MIDDEVRARVGIAATMARYATSVDRGDAAGVARTFAAHARLEVSSGGVMQGRVAIEAFYDKAIGARRSDWVAGTPVPLLRHNLTTSRVDLESPTRATGRTYFMTLTAVGLDHAGIYTDVYKVEDGLWLFEDRIITVEWFAAGSWYEQVRLRARAAGQP